ncbi:hypothetical protein TSMEX_006634 [Taenia solium]|eukprot:TsM_001067000 transcript=TsM_001067000 gene=TsM_001067000
MSKWNVDAAAKALESAETALSVFELVLIVVAVDSCGVAITRLIDAAGSAVAGLVLRLLGMETCDGEQIPASPLASTCIMGNEEEETADAVQLPSGAQGTTLKEERWSM